MNKCRFIYFDVGGTLIDWSNVFKTAASKFKLTAQEITAVFNDNHDPVTQGVLDVRQFWRKCIERYNLQNADSYDFLDSWVSDYQPIREVHELIFRIEPRFKIGLLSNIYKGMLPSLLQRSLIPNIHYEQIIFSCDVGMAKPSPDIYALAQKRAGVDSSNILLVDDSNVSLEEAKRSCWNTFFFDNKNRERSVKELEKYLSDL